MKNLYLSLFLFAVTTSFATEKTNPFDFNFNLTLSENRENRQVVYVRSMSDLPLPNDKKEILFRF